MLNHCVMLDPIHSHIFDINCSQFLGNCAQLLRPGPNFLTAYSGEEVEHQKMFLALNFITRKS